MARYTEAQNRATQKYIKSNYDEIKVRVKKGEKEKYKRYAESKGCSLNQLIIYLLENEIGE